MKKALSVLSIGLAAVLAFTGCGGAAASGSAGSGSASASSDSPYLCSSEPVTFTFFNIFDNITFNPEWQVFQEAAKMTNVTLESSVSQSSSDETTAFNLMLSSGSWRISSATSRCLTWRSWAMTVA